MTNQTTALVSRQAAGLAPSVPPQAMAGQGGVALTEAIQVANALSQAGPLIPAPYRDQPGAVLAVLMWSQANNVDPFTAMLNIHLIDEKKDGNPKPFVSAEMRVELASRKGFDFRVIESTRELCTIEVWRGEECRGTWTSRITDVPEDKFSIDRATGQPKKKPGRNNTTYDAKPGAWDNYPHVMLLRDAERNADRLYVKTAAALVDVYTEQTDPEVEQADVVDVLTSGPQADTEPAVAADGLPAEPEFHISPDEEAAAQGDPLTDPPPPKVTEAQLRKLGVAKVLRTATELGQSVALVEDVAKDQDLARRVVERLGS